MSFVGKAISGIGQALGLTPKPPSPVYIPPAPMASSVDTSAQMDAAAQDAAMKVSRGRTSTMLTGGDGETEDQKYSSKVLLGQ